MIVIYITCSSIKEAKKIARHLLKKRLSACVNIFPHLQSMVLWPVKSGKIDQSKEVVMTIKSLERKYKQIEKEIEKIHSYDTPLIMAWPVKCVAERYFNWLKEEIK